MKNSNLIIKNKSNYIPPNINSKSFSNSGTNTNSNSNTNNTHLSNINTKQTNNVEKKSGIIDENLNKNSNPKSNFILNKSIINFTKTEKEVMILEQENENFFDNLIQNQFKLHFHEVNDFLTKLGLEKFVDNFKKKGITTIDQIISEFFNYLI